MPKRSPERTIKQVGKVKSGQRRAASRMKTKLNSLISQPVFNVAVLVLLLLSVFGGLRYLSARQVQGQVKFVEQPQTDNDDQSNNDGRHYSSPELFKGEVYDTSIRLREAGALGMAISLVVFTSGAEEGGTVPPNLEKIWSLIAWQNLMPPGMEMTNGELLSPSGKFIVRYQSAPLRFEILSIPHQNSHSPAIMLRFPLDRLDGRTLTYFQSTSTGSREVPPPFATLEKIVSAGWTLEQWRGELLPPKSENNLRLLDEEKRLLQETGK